MSTHTAHIRHLGHAETKTSTPARALTTNEKRLAAFIAVAAISVITVVATMIWANLYYWSMM
ncbi:MAG: hypothetical protein GC159_02660 [Phycisphaera sp.]|nr:hypothetical protein [Phycisphaera sp.]